MSESSDGGGRDDGGVPDVQVVGVDDDDLDEVFAALSAESARRVLRAVYDEPSTAPELARRLDVPVEEVGDHLDRLAAAGVVEAGDWRGDGAGEPVYAAPDEPLVAFGGGRSRRDRVLAGLRRVAPAVLGLAVLSLAVQWGVGGGPGGRGAAGPLVEPGVAFFLGGLVVLVAWVAWRWWTDGALVSG